MKIERKYLVASFLILFSIGLAYDSLSNYINPYVSVTKVTTNWDKYSRKPVQVMGRVSPESIIRSNEGTTLFSISDGVETLDVSYTGALPQNFGEEKDVVIIGTTEDDGFLVAEQILVKCPSKYEEDGDSQSNNHLYLAVMAIAGLAAIYLVGTWFWKRN